MNTQTLTLRHNKEIARKRKNRINKITIGLFITIIVVAIAMKIVDGALQDFGYGVDDLMTKAIGSKWTTHNTFHPDFWLNKDVIIQAGVKANHSLNSMVMHHPNFLWLFTQFTWITTFIILMFLIFRMFKYEDSLPRWLKWIMTQRTLSLVVMYDMIVGVVFWGGMFKTFQDNFVPGLDTLEFIMTVTVHAVIPILILTYSLIYLTRDKNASVLKEFFVLKGMIYPAIYMVYYILVSQVWQDPYGVTNLHTDFWGDIWKLPALGILIWILLGVMLLAHNLVLFKFNKLYDPEADREILKRREEKIEKIKRKVARDFYKNEAIYIKNEEEQEAILIKNEERHKRKKLLRIKEMHIGVKKKKKK